MAIYIKSTCDACTDSVCPPSCFAVYKVGGLGIGPGGVFTCEGCDPIFIGYLTAPTGAGSSLTVTCGPLNTGPGEYNSVEVAGVNSSGVVVSYKNAYSNTIDITYDDCVNGVFSTVFVGCPYYDYTYPTFTCPPE
jgi:hypothetical protein